METKAIAIIGGGYTGLTAAYRLSQAGHKVTLFEKNSELGGLAGDFKIQGTNIEKVYHHIFRSDTDIINLVTELGLVEKLMWCKSSMGIFYQGKILAFGTPTSLMQFSFLSFPDRIRVGLVLLYLKHTKNWKQFTKISAYEWLSKWTGKKAMHIIYEPLLKGKFHDYYKDVSMAWMWGRIHIRANSTEKGGEKLGYFDGGFDIITKTIEKALINKNVSIVTNANVESISTDANSKVKIIIDGISHSFDKIIATTPSHVFSNMIKNQEKLDPSYLLKLNSIKYLGAIVAVFSSDQDLGEYYWNNINDLSFPFLAFINHTKLISKSKYNDKYIYYIGTYVPHDHEYFNMSQEEIYTLWFKYLKIISPIFEPSAVIDRNLFKLKYAQHIVDLNYENKILSYITPLKNLYLSNFSQIFPEDRGTNYAIREGNKIANFVMED